MKYFYNLLIAISCSVCFAACSSDDTPIEDIENDIEYYVTCQLEEPKMHIHARDLPDEGVYCNGSFHKKSRVKDFAAVIEVECTDPKALIEIKLIINNKKVIEYSGNSPLHFSHRLKGKGPYLY